MKYTRLQKSFILISVFMATIMAFPIVANAMHIMEGYLPATHCVLWGVLCIPFVVVGLMRINWISKNHRKTILLLAMVGAYAFVLSALKMPSVTGSSSHPTGTGLGAVLFGPNVIAVVGVIVLLFQAILLAHGGLTTLGANTFSMAIAGPFVSYGIFKLLRKFKVNDIVSVGIACALGDLFTYCITSVQLGISHHGSVGVVKSIGEFMMVFAVTQIPLAIVEGILSAVVMSLLKNFARPELEEIGYM